MIMREKLRKARKYIMEGLAILLAIILAPAGLLTLVGVAVIDVLKEIADEE